MYRKLLLLIPVAIMCSSCAKMEQWYENTYCNPNGAYSVGINDAKNSDAMQANFAASCPDNNMAINKSYRRGYKFGLANKPTEININPTERRRRNNSGRIIVR